MRHENQYVPSMYDPVLSSKLVDESVVPGARWVHDADVVVVVGKVWKDESMLIDRFVLSLYSATDVVVVSLSLLLGEDVVPLPLGPSILTAVLGLQGGKQCVHTRSGALEAS